MKKKYTLVGIIIIILIGIGCFAISGHESDDISADVKQENEIKTSESEAVEKETNKIDDVTESTITSESKTSQTQLKKDNDKTKETSAKKEQTETKETSTKHTHSWTAVYKEVDNGEYEITTTKTPWVQCNRCGADITSNPNGHLKMHLDNGETEVLKKLA